MTDVAIVTFIALLYLACGLALATEFWKSGQMADAPRHHQVGLFVMICVAWLALLWTRHLREGRRNGR